MLVSVNEEKIEIDESLSQKETLTMLFKLLEEKRLVVMEAQVNGIHLDGDLSALLDINQIDSLDLTVGTPEQITLDGLETAVNYLPKLKEGIADTAVLFQEGRDGEAIAKFLEIHPGLDWLNHVLHGAAEYLDQEEKPGNFKGLAATFRKHVSMLTEAWENQDYVLIADIMEYELVPFIEEMLPLITELIDRVAQKADNNGNHTISN